MKVLSIREPWASLIIEGYKEYEFRSWKTKYKGKILIHASLGVENNNLNRFKDYNININPGYIIGEAILEECIEVTDDFEKELYKKDKIVYAKSEHKRVYAWKLSNVKKYDEPIRAKGKLGLWNYSVEK